MVQKILEYFGYSTEPLFGVDISSTSVKLIKLGQSSGRYRVENYALEPLPPNAVIEKNIHDIEMVSQALKNLVERSGVTTKHVAIGVSSGAAITRMVQIAADQSEDEIMGEIELDADRYIPYPLDEVNLDFEILGPSEHREDMVDVLVVATRKENIELRVEALEQAGLIPSIIDVDSFATERAFDLVACQLPEHGTDHVVALFDIGATTTSMNVFDNLKSVYTREQAFGGMQLTQEIQERYGLTYEEAVMAKKFSDLPDDYIPEVLDPFKETVAQQISRACQFFFSSGEYSQINYIVLSGGTAAIHGLDTLVSKLLETRTFVANPFADMLLSPRVNASLINSDAPALMSCCGLALRNFDR